MGGETNRSGKKAKKGKAKKSLRRQLSEASFWLDLCPGMHISSSCQHPSRSQAAEASADVDVASLRQRMVADGYFTVPSSQLGSDQEALAAKLARAITALTSAGWPATFVFVFDEAWAMVARLERLMRAATGNRLNYDTVCWLVTEHHHTPARATFVPHLFSPGTFARPLPTPTHGG